MKEKIKERLKYLKELTFEVKYQYFNTKYPELKKVINETQMLVNMEINFLNELLQYDVIKNEVAVCDCKKYNTQPARMCSAENCVNKLEQY